MVRFRLLWRFMKASHRAAGGDYYGREWEREINQESNPAPRLVAFEVSSQLENLDVISKPDS